MRVQWGKIMRVLTLACLVSSIAMSNSAFAQSAQTYTWDGRQDFAAGYFDVFYEGGTFIALPSIYSNGLEDLIVEYPDNSSCQREFDEVSKLFNQKEILTVRASEVKGKNRSSSTVYRNKVSVGKISDISINGLEGWRFISRQEQRNSPLIRDFQRKICYGTSSTQASLFITPSIYYEGGVVDIGTPAYYDGRPDMHMVRKSDPHLSLARDASEAEAEIFDFNFDYASRIKAYADYIVGQSSEISPPKIESLEINQPPQMPVLEKDEFEKTTTFEERQKHAIEKWELEVRKVEAENQKIASEQALKSAKAEQDYNDKLQTISSESYRQKVYRESFSEGIKFVLGKPYFRDILYDADAEKMSATVFSAQDETFTGSVTFDVPLSTARSFKSDLQNKKIVPVITFDENLNVISAKTLSNTGLVDLDFHNAKESGSVELLQSFINEHPQSSKVELAKNEIIKLKNLRREKEAKQAAIRRDKEIAEKKLAEKKAAEAFQMTRLGNCEIGNTIYHRETWNTKTSSGNIIADSLFGAATKEEFVIVYEAVVKARVGSKVEAVINDYGVKQTQGGGFLQPKTWAKYDISSHADKYIGKTQFYESSRCD